MALLKKRDVEISYILSDARNSKVTDGNRLMNMKKRKEKRLGRSAQAKSDKNHQVDTGDMIWLSTLSDDGDGVERVNNKNNRQEMTDSDMLPSDSGGLVEMKREERDKREREFRGKELSGVNSHARDTVLRPK